MLEADASLTPETREKMLAELRMWDSKAKTALGSFGSLTSVQELNLPADGAGTSQQSGSLIKAEPSHHESPSQVST